MNEIVSRERSADLRSRADSPSREWWQSIPLDLAMSVFAIILAAGLKLAGVLP